MGLAAVVVDGDAVLQVDEHIGRDLRGSREWILCGTTSGLDADTRRRALEQHLAAETIELGRPAAGGG
ncbi:hypothetical protein ABTM84_18835, partial [Acinetobacter baumannii]